MSSGSQAALSGLAHFNQESRLSLSEIVHGSDASKYTIHQSDMRGIGGNEAADLSEKNDMRYLPEQAGFAGHVGSGENDHLVIVAVAFQSRIVCHVHAHGQNAFQHRMAAVADLQAQ